ncbi:hypothetical protein JTB14_026529 [Gonioctena quinquepunctata]|nr:hypothetical protein JTB14_026529 [Gonioctena quinquepunctata]
MQNSTRIPGENRGRGRSNSRNRGGRGQQGNWRTQREENLGHNEGWLPRGRSPHPRNESSNTENPNNYRRENDRGHRPFRNNNQPNNYSRGQNHQRGDSRENRPPNNDQSNQRKIRQMGFRYLQDLLKKDDLEEIIFTLNNDKRGYKELLESRDMSNDIIVLILQLLCRVCECSFQSSKIQLFESALRSPFSDNVIKFVSTIAIQNEREKRFNSCFWKDTDEFWNNIISLARNLHDLIPTSSCEVMVKLLKAVKLNIPIIETTHSIHISDNIKNDIENLFDLVEKTSKEVERKKELRPQGVDNEDMEPPDDFREISVYPSPLEVTNPKSPFLRPNVTEGPYRDVDHYLDVQFRLLREDFVAPLRKAICSGTVGSLVPSLSDCETFLLEAEERKRRSANLMVYNFPYNGNNPDDDKRKICQLFKDIVPENCVKKVFRIGKKTSVSGKNVQVR